MALDQSGIGCANDVESDHDGLEIWKGYVNVRRGRLKGVLLRSVFSHSFKETIAGEVVTKFSPKDKN